VPVCSRCKVASPGELDAFCEACGASLAPVASAPRGDEAVATRPEHEGTRRLRRGTPARGTAPGLERASPVVTAAPATDGVLHPRQAADVRSRLGLPAPSTGARSLAAAAPGMDLGQVMSVGDGLLDIAARLERAGLGWTPRAEDLAIDGGAPRLVDLRVAPLAPGTRTRLAALAQALAACVVPLPATLGPARLVRLLVAPPADLTVDPMRAELEAARSEAAANRREPAQRIGAASDVGLKHAKNEDAFAFASGDEGGHPWAALVVCDGVSTSTQSEEAAAIAAATARDVLAQFVRSGDAAYESATAAIDAAVRAAHVAVCATPLARTGDGPPPGATIVAALIHRRRLAVGWLGDSRAYWIGPAGAELLTRDHSWINEVVARGEMTEEEARNAPLAHAITRCLGPLEVGEGAIAPVDPQVRALDLAGPGMLLLCTDGLWNYFPQARDLAAAIAALGPGAPLSLVARHLVNRALVMGGADNVTVAVTRFGGVET
jgi:serine/threonine protein phosphatase PrpC